MTRTEVWSCPLEGGDVGQQIFLVQTVGDQERVVYDVGCDQYPRYPTKTASFTPSSWRLNRKGPDVKEGISLEHTGGFGDRNYWGVQKVVKNTNLEGWVPSLETSTGPLVGFNRFGPPASVPSCGNGGTQVFLV